jgi:hypothetical protein
MNCHKIIFIFLLCLSNATSIYFIYPIAYDYIKTYNNDYLLLLVNQYERISNKEIINLGSIIGVKLKHIIF